MAITTRRKTTPPPEAVSPPASPAPPLEAGFQPGRTQVERLELQAFARRLHELMAERGLSQSDLARAVWGKSVDGRGYDVAKNRDRISSYLKARSIPEPANMAKLAAELGVSVTELAPDAVAAAVDRAHPAFSMTVITGHADKTHLQVNKLVRMETAAKIAQLLSEDEART